MNDLFTLWAIIVLMLGMFIFAMRNYPTYQPRRATMTDIEKAKREHQTALDCHTEETRQYRALEIGDEEFLQSRHSLDTCRDAVEAIWKRGSFTTELTPEGEQFVIPGAERQTTKKNPQGELFS